ncbi:hypothetical protein PF008_g30382 [Phytophthora fragariae]|uniref:Uncharacterized protein n=1 Tax=Phytophthora fragariae TaxID=53985 RepID=A0A6G0Q5Q3_9STRA|nr:hypothetical protein PF008_g30382 [Phytophthora fragariae]
MGKVFTMPRPNTKDAANVTKLELDYTVNVRKVLYITEFIILLNYVEVIVPIIFSKAVDVLLSTPILRVEVEDS